jgi:hypothetical protein
MCVCCRNRGIFIEVRGRYTIPNEGKSSVMSAAGRNWPILAAIVAAILLASPLWSVAMPAMPDYPAHLATFYLLMGHASQYYAIDWTWVPNLASEAIVPMMARILPLAIAAKLFISATVIMWVLGPAAIQRALYGRSSASVLLAAFFAYNVNFMWGFLNYTFAMGVAYLVFAAWIATDGNRSLLRILGFTAAITAIYFCHLFALATLLLMIGCYELSVFWRGSATVPGIARRAAILAAIVLPAAVAFIVLKPAGDGGKFAFDFADSLLDRYEAAIQYHFDVPAYFLTGTLIVVFIAGAATRILRIDNRMFGVLAALLLGTLFMPEWAMGGWGVDLRLPPVLGAIAFAATDLRLPSRQAIATGTVSLIGLGFSALVLAGNWQYYDARYREFRANATAIRPDARVLTVLDGDSLGWSSDQPYWHMGEYAVIDRAAATQLLFATRGQHVVRVNPPLEEYVAETAEEGSPPDISELTDLAQNRANGDIDIETIFPYLMRFQCHFDQVLMVHGGGTQSPVPPMLKPRHEGSFYTIYDIVHDQRCTI